MQGTMTIRNATVRDINDIVTIHIDAFKGFFLTSLGTDFLKFYYTVFLKSSETVTLVAEKDGKVAGFSAATTNSKGFNSRLIRGNLFSFVKLSLILLFSDPKALFRLAKNLTKKSSEVADNEEYAELYSIGVDRFQQGNGIGKKMLAATEDALREKGVEKVSLTTDYINNERTVGFYRTMGYETLYVFVAFPNRKMYRFIKTL